MARRSSKKEQNKRTVARRPRFSASNKTYTSTPQKDRTSSTREKRALRDAFIFKAEVVLVCLLFGYIVFRSLSIGPAVELKYTGDVSLTPEDESSLIQGAENILSESRFNRLTPLLPRDELRELALSLPFVADAGISTNITSNSLVISVEVDEPTYTYSNSQATYLLGKTGVVLSQYEPRAGDAYVQISDATLTQVTIGQRVLSGAQIDFFTTFIEGMDQQGRAIDSFELTAEPSEVTIRLSGLPYSVRAYTNGDPAGQVASTALTLNYLEQEEIIPSSYIDVRLVSRAIYR